MYLYTYIIPVYVHGLWRVIQALFYSDCETAEKISFFFFFFSSLLYNVSDDFNYNIKGRLLFQLTWCEEIFALMGFLNTLHAALLLRYYDK